MSALTDAILAAGEGTLPPGFAEQLAPIIGELEDRVYAVEQRLSDAPPIVLAGDPPAISPDAAPAPAKKSGK